MSKKWYVVHTYSGSEQKAKTALEALPIEWDKGPNAEVSSESIAKWLEEGLTADTKFVGNKAGDARATAKRIAIGRGIAVLS